MTAQRFKGKVAIVTGSNRGIGKATAIELAKRGASVVINGRDRTRLTETERELRTYSPNILAVCADISIPAQAGTLIDQTIEAFGKLDILVNNAAVSMRGRFAELEPEVFKTIFDTNVSGVVNCIIPALPHIRSSHGSIVLVSSLAGIRGLPIQSAYCSSKMALQAIADSIRVEEMKSRIHVGVIRVGITETEPDKKILAEDGSLKLLRETSVFKVWPAETVARAILRNIRKRRARTTLTALGRALSVFQAVVPALVDRLLIYATDERFRRIH